jgi:hypothetical protein
MGRQACNTALCASFLRCTRSRHTPTSSRRRRRSHCISPQAHMHVVCGAGVWLPSPAYIRRLLLVCIACGAGVWLPSPAYMRRPTHKGLPQPSGILLPPCLGVCLPSPASMRQSNGNPPTCETTPRSGPHCDELPNWGQGEYRVVTHLNPERGRSLCGPSACRGGAWPLARWACPVCAAGATPLIMSGSVSCLLTYQILRYGGYTQACLDRPAL